MPPHPNTIFSLITSCNVKWGKLDVKPPMRSLQPNRSTTLTNQSPEPGKSSIGAQNQALPLARAAAVRRDWRSTSARSGWLVDGWGVVNYDVKDILAVGGLSIDQEY